MCWIRGTEDSHMVFFSCLYFSLWVTHKTNMKSLKHEDPLRSDDLNFFKEKKTAERSCGNENVWPLEIIWKKKKTSLEYKFDLQKYVPLLSVFPQSWFFFICWLSSLVAPAAPALLPSGGRQQTPQDPDCGVTPPPAGGWEHWRIHWNRRNTSKIREICS